MTDLVLVNIFGLLWLFSCMFFLTVSRGCNSRRDKRVPMLYLLTKSWNISLSGVSLASAHRFLNVPYKFRCIIEISKAKG